MENPDIQDVVEAACRIKNLAEAYGVQDEFTSDLLTICGFVLREEARLAHVETSLKQAETCRHNTARHENCPKCARENDYR